MHTLFPSYEEVDYATRLLGKLDGITKLLPDADFFLLMYLRKDAASSSQIEGTQTTMIDAIQITGTRYLIHHGIAAALSGPSARGGHAQ